VVFFHLLLVKLIESNDKNQQVQQTSVKGLNVKQACTRFNICRIPDTGFCLPDFVLVSTVKCHVMQRALIRDVKQTSNILYS